MYWDYNIDITNIRDKIEQQRQLLYTCIQLGYTNIVYNTDVSNKLNNQLHINKLKPIQINNNDLLQYNIYNYNTAKHIKHIKQYYRLTLIIDNPNELQQLNPQASHYKQLLHSYDIISVQCNNEQCFVSATQCDYIDIITLDCNNKLPYYIKKPQIHTSLDKQIYFEVIYGTSLNDNNKYKYFISHILSLLRISNAKNLIISSGATQPQYIRNINDVYNILTMCSITQDNARRIIRNVGDSILLHANTRNNTVKGVFQQISDTAKSNLVEQQVDANMTQDNET